MGSKEDNTGRDANRNENRGQVLQNFHRALLQYFKRHELANLLLFKLTIDIDVVAGGDNNETLYAEVIRWSLRVGRLPELAQAAAEAREHVPELAELAGQIAAQSWDGIDLVTTTLQVSVAEEPEPHFTVPFPRNPRFVGRAVELQRLHDLLAGEDSVGIIPAGLTGMGGIGKTQLAVEYCYRYQEAYPGGIFWLNAVDPLRPQLVDVARLLQLSTANPNDADQDVQMVAALHSYLQQRLETLIVYDNVGDPAQLRHLPVGPLLTPQTLGGRVLFTTRRKDLPAGLTALNVSNLPLAEARRMILAVRPDADIEVVDALCRIVGRLPLALNLAVAALENSPGTTPADYITALKEQGAEELHRDAGVELEDYYALSLTPVLREQYRSLELESARQLLRVAGQLAEAEYISVTRLGLLAGVQNAGFKPALTRGLAELANWSLVEPLAGGEMEGRENRKPFSSRKPFSRVRLHPLVREFARDLTAEGATAGFRTACAQRVWDTYADFGRMEEACAGRGVDALQRDYLAALEMLRRLPAEVEPLHIPPWRKITRHDSPDYNPELWSELEQRLRFLRREAGALRGWDKTEEPGRFAQQALYRLKLMDDREGLKWAEHHLSNIPHIRPLWS